MASAGVKYKRLPVHADTPPVVGWQHQHARVGCLEYAVTVASRFYFSHFYRVIYFFTVLASLTCIAWTAWNHWSIPSSLVFIALEIAVSALLVFEVMLRMVAYRRRFWSKWCNIFDVVALAMSLVSVAMYFNEEGFVGELEEVATGILLAFRNTVQYIRLAIFLKNRSEQIGGTQVPDIDFDHLSVDDDALEEVIAVDAPSESSRHETVTDQAQRIRCERRSDELTEHA
ncbi:hypothetical protein PINS_up003497 [Pythium insidiosum]|nr:hypothetical protein PINS_up003497 [Pythium insidiosum]